MSTRLLHKGIRSTVTAAAAAANNVRGPRRQQEGRGERGRRKEARPCIIVVVVIGGMCGEDHLRQNTSKIARKSDAQCSSKLLARTV